MAKFNLDYYTGKDTYSDGDIEETILDMVKAGRRYEDLTDQEISFPVAYHLSEVRKNILSWYPFPENASVLEIGAGCGAVTGLFCEKCASVTAVDISRRRAEINYQRNKQYDNLEIIAANLSEIPFSRKFDVIVLNGVFEYAGSFTEGDRPYHTFLSSVRDLLQDKGQILIAIENRLGAKYFAGAPEDHLNTFFTGINEYPGVHSVRTFSAGELRELAEDTGLHIGKFYYPYPDYKFPSEIFTDTTINTSLYGRPCFNFSDRCLGLIDQQKLLRSLAAEGVADKFANSFLAVLTREEEPAEKREENNILYVKINTDRDPAFRIQTVIGETPEGERFVKKIPVSAESYAHVDQMKERSRNGARGFRYLPDSSDMPHVLSYPFLKNGSLDTEAAALIDGRKGEAVEKLLDEVRLTFLNPEKTERLDPAEQPEFRNVFLRDEDTSSAGVYACVRGSCLDLILDNIFRIQDKFYVIDYEWVFDFAVPAPYIMWRTVNELYFRHPALYDILDRTKLLDKYSVTEEDEAKFRKWEHSFAYLYVGSSSLQRMEQPEIPVDLNAYAKRKLDEKKAVSRFYFDFGNGYREDLAEDVPLELGKDGTFTLDLVLRFREKNPGTGSLAKVRWDPCEVPCIVENLKCTDQAGEEIPLAAAGAWTLGTQTGHAADFFSGGDPYYELKKKIKLPAEVRFTGKLCLLSEEACRKTLEQVTADREETIRNRDGVISLLRSQQDALNGRLSDTEQELQAYRNYVDGIRRSKLWYTYRGGHWAKRAAKKILGRDPFIYKDPDFDIHYGVEDLSLNGKILHVKGWIFDGGKTIDRLGLLVKWKGRETETQLDYGLRRDDIMVAFGHPGGKYSGFEENYRLRIVSETPAADAKAEVFLRFYAGEESRDIRIGAVSLSPLQDTEDEIHLERAVLRQNGDCLVPEMNPVPGQYISPFQKLRDLTEWKPVFTTYTEEVDVVVPVYNGYDFLEPLFRGLQRTKLNVHIILIDDKSPDQRVWPALQRYAAAHDNVEVLQNDRNLGFVGTTNRGLKKAKGHTAIVNTDVELPDLWLERLMEPIFAYPEVASTTPFSNSATIFSFPNFGENNRIYRGLSVDEIDARFRRVRPGYTIVPTGMGFCMGMNRKAINEIGYLDEKTFSKGYGEENDWCQRAIAADYVNVHVENLFVYHKHGGSFPSEEKQRLMEENSRKLAEKHPDYFGDVARYCEKNPLDLLRKLVRIRIDTELSAEAGTPGDRKTSDETRGGVVLALNHDLGGGADAYLQNKITGWNQRQIATIEVRYRIQEGDYSARFVTAAGEYTLTFRDMDELKYLSAAVPLREIMVNELVTYPQLFPLLRKIRGLAQAGNSRLTMLIHDFFAVSPLLNLVSDRDMRYEVIRRDAAGNVTDPGQAGAGPEDIFYCDRYYKENHEDRNYSCPDISTWRRNWRDFLEQCTEVRTFSGNSAEILGLVYPGLANVTTVPHEVKYMLPCVRRRKLTKTLNVGLLGVLSRHKGKDVIRQCVDLLQQENAADIRFILVGTEEKDPIPEGKYFEKTGRYEVEDLPEIVLEKDIDLFLIPSVWPETFSYTTEEVMQMGIPAACFPVGAPAERIGKYEKGRVIGKGLSLQEAMKPEQVLREIRDFGKEILQTEEKQGMKDGGGKDLPAGQILCVAEYISYSSRYRLDHFREQLLYTGMPSSFVEAKDLPAVEDAELEKTAAVFVYRCRLIPPLDRFLERVKAAGIPVIYDIDDYIFDYDAIREQPFLKDPEYKDYAVYCDRIDACMQQADCFTTSTETLGKAIREKYGKPVLVNRNVASGAMAILSRKAVLSGETGEPGTVTLGYFSGSKTHDADFAMIEDLLIDLMDRHPEVQLLIVGCLRLSRKFDRFIGRTRQMDFQPWRSLPGLIRQADISLMPLSDSFFNQCKSENKWTESALTDRVVIASNNPEIRKAVPAGTIILCSTEEDWKKNLEELVTNAGKRQKIADAARDYVMQHKLTLNTGDAVRSYVDEIIDKTDPENRKSTGTGTKSENGN